MIRNRYQNSKVPNSKTGILHDLELPLKFRYFNILKDLRLESMVYSQIILKEFCMIQRHFNPHSFLLQ